MKELIESESMFKDESIERLMLISILGAPPHRRQALKELQQRQLIDYQESTDDCFIADLGVIF